jgi:hypothetical protein
VVGTERWEPKARDYRALAERIGKAGADGVYLGGLVYNNGPRLIKDLRQALGPDVAILAPHGFALPVPIVEGAEPAAEGFISPPGELLARR